MKVRKNPFLASFVTSRFFKSFLIPVYFFSMTTYWAVAALTSYIMTVFDVSTALYCYIREKAVYLTIK